MIPEQDAERRALIGEYVLGLLEGEEAGAVRLLLQSDRDAARIALEWEAYWLELADRTPAAEPSAALWVRIRASLDSSRQTAPSLAQRIWSSLNLWRLTSAALAFGLLLSVLNEVVREDTPTAFYTVVLQAPGEAANPGWVVRVDGSGNLELDPLVSDSIPADRSVQFWTLLDPAEGPRSLGLVQPGQSLRLSAEQIGPVQPGQLFELTLEPAGGSPLNRPTGEVLYIGRAVIASVD